MKFAYADPPYIGQAHRYPEKTEVDHRRLLRRLREEYPDGWALSASSPSLSVILPWCPLDVRVMAWVKPFAVFKPNVGVAYAWEPVILYGGRKRTRQQPTVRDWVSENITLRKGLVGAKPKEFCFWLFDVLNIQPDDTLDDLFPGTGIVTTALAEYRTRLYLGPIRELRAGEAIPPTQEPHASSASVQTTNRPLVPDNPKGAPR